MARIGAILCGRCNGASGTMASNAFEQFRRDALGRGVIGPAMHHAVTHRHQVIAAKMGCGPVQNLADHRIE